MNSITTDNASQFGRVAVLMGGNAAERDISLVSGTAVFEALQRKGVDVVAIDVKTDIISALQGQKIDRVFNVIHGRGGEDGVVQGVLETMKIPYTGSGLAASALTMDKLRTKLCWKGYGLPTPEWFDLKSVADIVPCATALGFPVIVKPALEGSSLGMSKAHNLEELKQAFLLASEYQCDVYAEAWVKGDEYTVAVLGGHALPAIRLETPNVFYDYEAKYQSDQTHYYCPSGLSQEQEEALKAIAVMASNVAGVEGWGRVDLFIDENARTQLIEVNTVPGMTDHSLVPMAARACGIEFDELVWKILETSFK